MILPILGIIAAFIAYRLFVRGCLFKLIIAAAFLLVTPVWLGSTFPASLATAITIGGLNISIAWAIPLVILILALATTRTSE